MGAAASRPAHRGAALVIGADTPSRQNLQQALAADFDVEALSDPVALRRREGGRGIDVVVVHDARDATRAEVAAAMRDRSELSDAALLAITDTPHDVESLRRLRDGLEDRVSCAASADEVRVRAVNLAVVARVRHTLRAAGETGEAPAESSITRRLDEAGRSDAEAASRAKDEFLAVLAHELRTPLNAVLGWVGILRRPGVSDADLARGLAVIDRSARAQARLIEDVLEVSAMVRRKIELKLDPVRVRPVLVEALDAIRPAAEAKGIRIDDAVEADGVTVLADSQRLLQVLGNLLGNAVKFTPEGGRVTVELRAEDNAVMLRVQDTGVGIAADFLPRIFDAFTQAVNPLTERPRGLGLGLAIARHLVELQGGTLEAASQGVGRGATFTIRLPLLRVPQSAERT